MNGAILIVAMDATRRALEGIAPRVMSWPGTDEERIRLLKYLQWAAPSRLVIAVDEGQAATDDAVNLRQAVMRHVDTVLLIPAARLREAAAEGRQAVLGLVLPLCETKKS